MIPAKQRQIVEALRTEHSVRDICGVLGIPRSTLYYQPKLDSYEESLRTRIEQLAATYPTYGYRRITKVLAAEGHPVGYKRVARLMKAANLSVSVKRACQTTHSLDGPHPWQNRLKSLDICRCDQVWVGDITYVRLKHRFIYVALLMDVFTRMIRGWNLSQHLTQSLRVETLRASFTRWDSGDPSFRSRRASIFQRRISQRFGSMGLRFRSPTAGVLGRTDTLKG